MPENTMDSGKIVKMDVDYSSNCDTKIPECKKLAQEGKLHDALDQLLTLEKLTRTVKLRPDIPLNLLYLINTKIR